MFEKSQKLAKYLKSSGGVSRPGSKEWIEDS